MDFKGATRLFQDPEFDGEPVTVHEPAPDEFVLPPEEQSRENEQPDRVADEDAPPTDSGDDQQPDDPAAGTRDPTAGRARYTIDDVEVRTAIERSQYLDAHGRLVTEDYRVLLKDQIRQTLRREFTSLDDFLRRWTASERKQAIIEALRDQGLPLSVLAQAVPNGEALDAFDLIAHVAFDQPPPDLTNRRRERAEQVRKPNYRGKYGDQAKAVLDALLEKYADHGIGGIEDPQVLELPPFDKLGGKRRIRRGVFGGPEKFSEALTELERQLYKESA
jgi:type I restriction enzyme R subunit